MRLLIFVSLFVAGPLAMAEWDVEMSAYNHCESGGDESRWGDKRLKPSEMELDKNPKYAMIAVSKVGGTNAMRGQCFTATGGEPDGSKASHDMLSKIRSVIFVAADSCPACSNKNRVDVSTSCDSHLNRKMFVTSLKLHETDCPKDIQAKMHVGGGERQTASARSSARRVSRYARATR